MAFWITGWVITSILMYLMALSEMTPEEQNKGMPIEGFFVLIVMPLFAWPLYLTYAIYWWSKVFLTFIKESSQSAHKGKSSAEHTLSASMKADSPGIEAETSRTQKTQKKPLVSQSDAPKGIPESHTNGDRVKLLHEHPSPNCKGLVKHLEIYLNNMPKHLLMTGSSSTILYDFRRWLTDSEPEKYELYKRCFFDFNLWQTRELIESKLYLKRSEHKRTSNK